MSSIMGEKRIKICFVIDSLIISGAGKLTMDVIKKLHDSGADITLITFYKHSLDSENLDYSFLGDNNILFVDIYKLKFISRILLLRKIFVKYDVIHSCLEMSNLYCSLVNILTFNKKKYLATIHGIDGIFIDDKFLQESFNKNVGIKYKLLIKYISNITLRSLNLFIAVSNDTRNFLIKRRGISFRKIKVIYHGIDIKSYPNPNMNVVANLKARYCIKDTDFVIGYLGRLARGKGLEYLLDTFKGIYNYNKQYKFLIVGEGELYEYLQAEIKRSDLEDKVFLCGSVLDVENYYTLFDVYILPSFSEGIPISLLEAMYYKRIVICTDVGGIPEVIINKYNGFLIEKNNFTELESTIKFVYDNSKKLGFLKKNGYSTVLEKFNFDSNAYRIIDLFLR